ncbi:MAG: BatA domain-containing protein, partial [Kiritimatiellales bacterium]|nr:BatA domain-containing protein [Kiritimatiellales bacterium]
MELAFAGFLAGLAALAVPILLHLLKKNPTQQTPFPSLHFLRVTLARRSANNTLRKRLVLLLRCLCLLALVLAFCRPYLPRFAKQPETVTVVLWDHSFSMQAAPYRDFLYRECLRQLDRACAEDPMLLGLVSKDVAWSGEFTGKANDLRAFFELQKEGEGSSSFETALRLADSLLLTMPGKAKKIILITDRQTLPWKATSMGKKLSPGIELDIITPPAGGFINAAVTAASPQKPYAGANSRIAADVTLRNFSDVFLPGVLICLLDGQETGRHPVVLPPHSIITRTMECTGSKPQHGVEIRLDVADQLPIDNSFWLALNTTPLPTICAGPLPSGDTDFLQMAFNPMPSASSVNWIEWNPNLSLEKIAQADLFVVRDGFSLNTEIGQCFLKKIQQGGSAVLLWNNAPNMRNLLLQFGVAADLIPKEQTQELDFIDFDHPVFKPFLNAQVGGLFNILFFSPPVLTLPGDAQILAAYQDGSPAIAELAAGKGRLIVIASGMDRRHTDWPTRASYLPFWRELFDYCKKEQRKEQPLQVSSTPLFIPGLQRAQALSSGEPILLEPSRLPAEKSGNYLVYIDEVPRIVSINVPPEESDPAQLETSFDHKTLMSTEPVQKEFDVTQPVDQGSSFWFALFIVATLAALGEMLLANRT